MNMIKFARLASQLANRFAVNFNDDDLIAIAGVIQEIIEAESKPALATIPISNKIDLVPLFSYMLNNRKIDAIREHRAITGMGLKESKDEIDRLMAVMKLPEHAVQS